MPAALPDFAPPAITTEPLGPLPHVPARPRGAWPCAVALLVGSFAIVLAGVDSAVFDLERHAVPKTFVLHLTAALCLPWLLPRWQRVAPGVLELLLGLFLLWSGVSALLAENRWLALQSVGITFSACVLFLVARRVATSNGARRLALSGIGAAATLGAALGVLQAYGVEIHWLAEDRAPGGTFGNRNFLAHLVTIASPLLLLGALRARRTLLALLPVAALALVAAAVILTRSRAGWLAMAMSMLVMGVVTAVASRRTPRLVSGRRLVVLTGVLGCSALLAIALPNRLVWTSDSPYTETLTRIADFASGSGRGRIIQWQNSLALVPENPLLGVGPGNWFVHYPRVTRPGDPSFAGADPIPTNPWPSSDWVAMLVERGVPGAALLLLAGLAAAAIAVRRALSIGDRHLPRQIEHPTAFDPLAGSDERSPKVARAIACLGMLTAALVAGLFDAVLLLPAPAFFLWTAAGLLLPTTGPVLKRALTPGARRRASLLVVGATMLVTAVAAGQLIALVVAGDRPTRDRLELAVRFDPGSHRLHLLLARRGPCNARLPHARAAAVLMPYHASPRQALAACGVRDRG
jgi:O-antigen ligase